MSRLPQFLLVSVAFGTIAVPMGAIAKQGPQTVDDNIIVVTGQSLDTTLKALEDCLARGCPPEEDIRLSLAHAENLFVEGEYKDGQSTLRGSIKRTKDHKGSLPVEVAGLYRASSRIAEHLGEPRDYRSATLDMRDVLEDGLGEDDPRTMVAQITVGDSRAKLGYPDEAERIYKRVEEDALEAGHNRVASFARLRLALLYRARWEENERVDTWFDPMMEQLALLRDDPLPGSGEFALIASVLQSRIDRQRGVENSTEELIKAFAQRGGVTRPVLLYAEPFRSTYRNIAAIGEDQDAPPSTNAQLLMSGSFNEPRFVDIGFLVQPDGRVAEIEVLRESDTENDWANAVMKNIATRRYAPMSVGDASPGFYQVERYTVTARYTDQVTGTRLRQREGNVRVERIDLTPDNYQGQAGEIEG